MRWYGDCPVCGHDWREHKPNIDTEACSECVYEVEHGQRLSEDPPCLAAAPPRA